MSPEHRAAAADTARETALPPSPGLDAAWVHPFLGRLMRGQIDRQRLDHRHPWVLDTAVVLCIAAISLPDLLSNASHGPFGDTNTHTAQLPTSVLVAFTIALVAPLWWRRRAPEVTFFVIALVSLVQWSLGVWPVASLSSLVALYSLARHGSPRVLGWATALTVVETTLAVFVLVPLDNPLFALFFLLGTVTGAIATGLTLRIRGLYLATLEDRARRLEIEHDQRVRLTAAAERSRVAREMHDIVGHNLSVMVSLADGAATLAAHRDEQSAEALRILGDTGRQAMSELRRVLGVLREDKDTERPLSPQPGIRDLDPLLARVRAAGLTVAYRTEGRLDSLGGGVQLTVYRIVQEALTNTLKHAGAGSAARVSVTAHADSVRIWVADGGTPPGTPARKVTGAWSDDSGHGLIGIRQRAAMYNGTVVIGPHDSGHGWIVDVVLNPATEPTSPALGDHLP